MVRLTVSKRGQLIDYHTGAICLVTGLWLIASKAKKDTTHKSWSTIWTILNRTISFIWPNASHKSYDGIWPAHFLVFVPLFGEDHRMAHVTYFSSLRIDHFASFKPILNMGAVLGTLRTCPDTPRNYILRQLFTGWRKADIFCLILSILICSSTISPLSTWYSLVLDFRGGLDKKNE
jgi:hypothetical protein